jgi:hypothetical protein
MTYRGQGFCEFSPCLQDAGSVGAHREGWEGFMGRLALLVVLALSIVVVAVFGDRVARRVALGPLLAVSACVAVFALAIRPLGLVAATIISIIVLNITDLRTRTSEVVAAMLLSVAVVVAMVMIANLPIYLWPRLAGL